MKEITKADDRDRISTVRAEEETYTGADKGRMRGQVETTDSGEKIGVITEEMCRNMSSHVLTGLPVARLETMALMIYSYVIV